MGVTESGWVCDSLQLKEQEHGNRDREVVQQREGVRVHHPGRRHERRFGALQRHGGGRVQVPHRGAESGVHRDAGPEGSAGVGSSGGRLTQKQLRLETGAQEIVSCVPVFFARPLSCRKPSDRIVLNEFKQPDTPGATMKLAIEDVYKSFDPFTASSRRFVLRGVTLQAAQGEFLSLLGHSGCGKSTLLNLVAGYIKPDRGRILIDGTTVEGPGADRGVVFQEYALFPGYTR